MIGANLLTLRLHCLGAGLRLRLTVGTDLLTFKLTGLRRLDASFANLLTSRLALDTRRTFGASLLANLLTLNPRRSFDTSLLADRLTFDASRLDALSANLLALDSSGALDSNLLDALGALRPFGTNRLLTLRPRLLARLSLLALGTRGLSIFLRPRIGRGRDRQCGDARGEKYPGHHNFSFSTA